MIESSYSGQKLKIRHKLTISSVRSIHVVKRRFIAVDSVLLCFCYRVILLLCLSASSWAKSLK